MSSMLTVSDHKLAILSFPLVSIHGGAAEAVLLSSKYLAKAGWDVRNFSLGCGRSSDCMSFEGANIDCYLASHLNTSGKVSLSELLRLVRDLRGFKPDIIMAHQIFNFPTCFSVIYRLFARVPLVICPHGSLSSNLRDKRQKLQIRLVKRLIVFFVLRFSRVILFNSPEEIAESGLRKNAKFKVAGLGIERPTQSINDQKIPNSIVFFGRLDPIKRLDLIIEAVEHLRNQGFKVIFHIYGASKDAHESLLRAMVSNLNLQNEIKFMPWQESSEIKERLRNYQVVVSASDSESFGLSLLEGIAHGAFAVMGSHLPNSHFVEKNGLGVLVSEQKSEKYAAAIEFAIKNCYKLSEDTKPTNSLTHFEWDSVIEDWNRVLVSIQKSDWA